MSLFSRRVSRASLEQNEHFHALLQRVKHLEDALAALEDRHERLRGKFYSARMIDKPAPLSKEQLLARHLASQQTRGS